MPWIQAWVDPNTLATYPASYVQVLNTPTIQGLQIGFTYGRWASVTAFSLGGAPLQRIDMLVTGSQYMANFATPVTGALGTFGQALYNLADTYVGSAVSSSLGVQSVASLGASVGVLGI